MIALIAAVRSGSRALLPSPQSPNSRFNAAWDYNLRFPTAIVWIFAGLALFLASVGIFGALSFSVGWRTREIGIRMALGARPADVRGMILAQTARISLLGIACGLAGAYALTRFVAALLFGVTARDPVTLISAAALLLFASLAACYIPTRRAMRVDPVTALRSE